MTEKRLDKDRHGKSYPPAPVIDAPNPLLETLPCGHQNNLHPDFRYKDDPERRNQPGVCPKGCK